jgi:anti-sigma factor RsiW
MKNACEKWKEQLRDAVLTGTIPQELAEHLQTCAHCAAELKDLETRRARLDTLLPLVARGSEPSADFRARVLAAAEAINGRKHRQRWRYWILAGATAMVAAVVIIGVTWHRQTALPVSKDELAAAQKLAEWRAPSDSLLATPGQEILRTTPTLGEPYLNVPVKKIEEE